MNSTIVPELAEAKFCFSHGKPPHHDKNAENKDMHQLDQVTYHKYMYACRLDDVICLSSRVSFCCENAHLVTSKYIAKSKNLSAKTMN